MGRRDHATRVDALRMRGKGARRVKSRFIVLKPANGKIGKRSIKPPAKGSAKGSYACSVTRCFWDMGMTQGRFRMRVSAAMTATRKLFRRALPRTQLYQLYRMADYFYRFLYRMVNCFFRGRATEINDEIESAVDPSDDPPRNFLVGRHTHVDQLVVQS